MKYEEKTKLYDDYNYFFVKLIVKVIQNLFILSIMLIICSIINTTFIYILGLLCLLYIANNIYITYSKYTFIIQDIKETLNIKNLTFEIDLNMFSKNLFKELVCEKNKINNKLKNLKLLKNNI